MKSVINEENSDSSSDEELSKDIKINSGEAESEANDEVDVIGTNDEEDDNGDYVDVVGVKDTVLRQVSLGGANKKTILRNSKIKKPSTQKLVDEAIQELNERTGSSLQTIQKFIMTKNPELVASRLKLRIQRYIKSSLTDGTMVQIKRSFKLTKKHGMKIKQKPKPKATAKVEIAKQPDGTTIKKIAPKKENTGKKLKNETKTSNKAKQGIPENEAKKKSLKKTEAAKNKATTKLNLKKEIPQIEATKKSIIKKDAKKTTEMKKMPVIKVTPKTPSKSINSKTKSASPHLDAANTATGKAKKPKNSTKPESASVASSSVAAVKVPSGQRKKK